MNYELCIQFALQVTIPFSLFTAFLEGLVAWLGWTCLILSYGGIYRYQSLDSRSFRLFSAKRLLPLISEAQQRLTSVVHWVPYLFLNIPGDHLLCALSLSRPLGILSSSIRCTGFAPGEFEHKYGYQFRVHRIIGSTNYYIPSGIPFYPHGHKNILWTRRSKR